MKILIALLNIASLVLAGTIKDYTDCENLRRTASEAADPADPAKAYKVCC